MRHVAREPQTSCVKSTNFFSKGPTAGSIAQFAYPTSALLAFLALRSICLYNSHGSLPRLEDAVVRRSVLLGLVALVIGTYVGARQCCTSTLNANLNQAASSINIFIRSVTGAEAGIDKDKEVCCHSSITPGSKNLIRFSITSFSHPLSGHLRSSSGQEAKTTSGIPSLSAPSSAS